MCKRGCRGYAKVCSPWCCLQPPRARRHPIPQAGIPQHEAYATRTRAIASLPPTSGPRRRRGRGTVASSRWLNSTPIGVAIPPPPPEAGGSFGLLPHGCHGPRELTPHRGHPHQSPVAAPLCIHGPRVMRQGCPWLRSRQHRRWSPQARQRTAVTTELAPDAKPAPARGIPVSRALRWRPLRPSSLRAEALPLEARRGVAPSRNRTIHLPAGCVKRVRKNIRMGIAEGRQMPAGSPPAPVTTAASLRLGFPPFPRSGAAGSP